VIVTLYQTSHAPIYAIPIIFVCGFYGIRLQQNHWTFLKLRRWQLFNGKFSLEFEQHPSHKVEVIPVYVRPHFIILKYKRDQTHDWDILLQRDCEHEGFRQLKAMLKIQQQSLQEN
jgi:hypothetical protein